MQKLKETAQKVAQDTRSKIIVVGTAILGLTEMLWPAARGPISILKSILLGM